ncbi:hypothetical protein C8F04DRAFT_1066463 [Mycena alexandri]|uniref:MYND-type domain-containing protein n=1 Tax=Mycena alexandri TaxID=1745969 RepID=A0AAD6TJ14_9AGAR|nr:hypothetical protein C8F04DRAFT_1066463 [Mycena alexandri]
MPPNRRVPSAPVIALEVDRLTLAHHRKKLPSTFLHSFCVKERLGDLSVSLLPNREPALDQPFTQTLADAEVTAVKLASDALVLFSRLAYLIDHDNPALRSMMLQLWDAGVWKWMIFLYNSGVDLNDTIANEGRPLSLTRQLITVGIVDALVGCADSVTLGKRLILVPDIVSLIGRLWVEDVEIPGRPNMVHKELTFTMYHIMNDDTTNGSIFSTLLDAVDGGAQTIMKAATDHFRRLISSTPVDPKDIDSQVYFIEFLATNSVLGDALHEVETLSVATLAIDALTKQSEQSKAHGAVKSCIELFLHHLLSGTSVKPLIHAINKGLLRSVYDARVAFHSNEDCCEALAEIIIQVVAPGLIFRSVLHAVERSETKTGFLASYRRARAEFHEWETFDEVYQDMIKFRNTIDEDVKPCGRFACVADESDAQVKLQRCGRCQYKMYCSKACQQEDWPNHKRHCRKESALEITPVSDREFARERAEFEVRSDMTSLCQRVKKNPALQTTEGLVFQVDFTTLDRNISIAIVPSERADRPDRTVAIYALVQSGAKKVRSLGLVTGWKELQMSTQPGSLFYPEKFEKLAKK